MLRNFMQIVRSGVTGRKSFGTAPRRAIRTWLAARSHESLFRDSIGASPSMTDVIRMVHPKPDGATRAALYAYLIGRPYDEAALPEVVRQFENWKKNREGEVPDVPFQMLTALELDTEDWAAIARNAPWQMTRMNLNTFARHGVFQVQGMTDLIARRLADPAAVRKAQVFPYQLMAAYSHAQASVPGRVREALQEAMETAIENVPAIEGQVFVCPDVSGSMQSPVTGVRTGATTAVRCIDVAALVAAAMVRKNPRTRVLPFSTHVKKVSINGRDSVMTNAQKLAAIGGGGTACSAPLELLNRERATGELVVIVSDNESWADARAGRGTALMQEWNGFRSRNPRARMVCIDIQPNQTTQAAERADVLNIGGFSDAVFEVLAVFAGGTLDASHWVGEIEKTRL